MTVNYQYHKERDHLIGGKRLHAKAEYDNLRWH